MGEVDNSSTFLDLERAAEKSRVSLAARAWMEQEQLRFSIQTHFSVRRVI